MVGDNRNNSSSPIAPANNEAKMREAIDKKKAEMKKNNDPALKTFLLHEAKFFEHFDKISSPIIKNLVSDKFLEQINKGNDISAVLAFFVVGPLDMADQLINPVMEAVASLTDGFDIMNSKKEKVNSQKVDGLLKPLVEGVGNLFKGKPDQTPPVDGQGSGRGL